MFKFEILHKSSRSRARVGRIHTPHGIIETPNYVPVGTNATVKALDSKTVDDLDVQLMFCNTYHLLLHPGPDVVAQAGGLHSFMNRTKPIITDSGGFQVFSLAYGTVHDELKSRGCKKSCESVLKISENGVVFRSYRDGSPVTLTPESSVQAQKLLGADIIIPLDELPPYHIDAKSLRKSFDRTHRWQLRSLTEHKSNPKNQAMYGVIHGGVDRDLRKESAQLLSREAFDGFAIGGSMGKTQAEMFDMLTQLMPELPEDKPNHLLGIGDPKSLKRVIELGIDTFDSSYPTRCARHGLLFCRDGLVNITRSIHKTSFEPVDSACSCALCTGYTRAYLHHLFKARELTGLALASVHNIKFMLDSLSRYREQIRADML